jgi:predicted nucleic acid-binding protein
VVVVDTSAAVDYLIESRPGTWVAGVLEQDPDLHAPHVLDVEVVGAVRRLLRLGELSAERASGAIVDLAALRVARHSHLLLLPRMWELRENVTARDSAFVALAELLGARLVTTDLRLARAPGIRAELVVP